MADDKSKRAARRPETNLPHFELSDFDVLKFEESAWLQAIIAADRWTDATGKAAASSPPGGDASQIVRLLRAKLDVSNEPIRFERLEIELLADLLDRHQLRSKPGGRKVPIYRNSWAELQLEAAADFVSDLRTSGNGRAESIAAVVGDDYRMEDQLGAFRAGKRGSSRRRSRKK